MPSSVRVEVPITDHLRDSASNLEKYKVVQFFFPCRKIEIDREDCNFFGNFILRMEIVVMILSSRKLA